MIPKSILKGVQAKMFKQAEKHMDPISVGRSCMVYAIAGCYYTQPQTKNYILMPHIGSLRVKLTDDPGDGKGPLSFAIDNARDDAKRNNEYHCWIGGARREHFLDGSDPGRYVIDFSSPYYAKQHAGSIDFCGYDPKDFPLKVPKLLHGDGKVLAEEDPFVMFMPNKEDTMKLQKFYVENILNRKDLSFPHLIEYSHAAVKELGFQGLENKSLLAKEMLKEMGLDAGMVDDMNIITMDDLK